MPITAGDLGQAISYGYKVPFGDSSNALLRGFQVGERQAAHRAAAELRRQQAKQKEDEEFNKSLASVNIKDVHPYLYNKAKEETATYLNQAQRLYKEDPIKNRFAVKNLINEATNNIYNLQERSKAWYDLDKTPDDELTEEGRRLKYLPREFGDARVVEGINSNITGEGYQNFMPNIRKRKAQDLNAARDKVFSDMRQDYVNQRQISPDTRLLEFGINDQIAQEGANLLWSNPQLREAFINQNIPYIREKFGKKKTEGALIADPAVQEDLYNKFVAETQKYAKDRGKIVQDAIPQQNNFNINLGLGGGSSNVSPADQGAGVTIRRPTSVPTGEGNNVIVKNADFNVPTGTPQGFKTVAIQNMRGDDFIALSNNKSLKGQPVQKVDVGQAIPMPVASKDLVDKTGKRVNKGELIDEDRLQSALDNNAVEWVAMIPGQADLGDGITESVVVPAQKVRRSVVISQAKDDAPLTDQSIQKAIDEANAKNEEIKKGGKFPLPKGKPRSVKQHGHLYNWNTQTGKYE